MKSRHVDAPRRGALNAGIKRLSTYIRVCIRIRARICVNVNPHEDAICMSPLIHMNIYQFTVHDR